MRLSAVKKLKTYGNVLGFAGVHVSKRCTYLIHDRTGRSGAKDRRGTDLAEAKKQPQKANRVFFSVK